MVASMNLPLPRCPYMGPTITDDNGDTPPIRMLPPDFATNPFKYLPPRYVLSEDEVDLAARYEQGDFSRGYMQSQIAYFRRDKTLTEHANRKHRFGELKGKAARLGIVLPPALVELVENDDYINRLRHNTVWLGFADEIVPLPSHSDHYLMLVFVEAQGCGNWHLLFAPDGSHMMALSEHGFGDSSAYPGGKQPDPSRFAVYECADSFNAWLVNYFAECVAEDAHYDRLLLQYPGQ